MVTVEITVREYGKDMARHLLRITKNSAHHAVNIPVRPVVIQKAEYSHDEQLTLLGLDIKVESVVASSKGSARL